MVRLPWAEVSSRFTVLFEALAISWLKEASQQGVAELLALSWDEIHGILERAVQRGLARRSAEPVAHLGVDEKSFRKHHRYLTVVNDLDRSRVLFVAEGRRQASLDGFWETLSKEQLGGVEAVAMDMWDPYVASTREHLKESDKKIVYDKGGIHLLGPGRILLAALTILGPCRGQLRALDGSGPIHHDEARGERGSVPSLPAGINEDESDPHGTG